MNLLKMGWLKALLRSAWFPLAAQVLMLAAFGLLVWGGWGIDAPDAAFAKVLRNSNLANLIVWSYWFPLVLAGGVLLGRVWCTVCPMELVTSAASRFGLKRRAPRWLASGWVITGFYAAILVLGVHTLGIHRIPHRMALYLLALLGAALAAGLVFEKRAFCSHVCPVGHLLGLYSHCSILEWRAADLELCAACRTKDCVSKDRRYALVRRSCTSNLYPAGIQDNRACLMCAQCVKVCPNENLRLSLRRPYADFSRPLTLSGAQLGFLMVVSGFVVYEILSEWGKSEEVIKWVPGRVTAALGLAGPWADFASAAVMFLIFPAALFLVVGGAARLFGKSGLGDTTKAFGLLLLPTVAGAHLIKSVLKTASRLPYWAPAMADPAGVETAQRIVAKTLAVDPSLATAAGPAVTAVAAAVLLVALGAMVWIVRRSPFAQALSAGARAVLLAGAAAYWAVFAVMVYLWRIHPALAPVGP